jgi:hypothetical protein
MNTSLMQNNEFRQTLQSKWVQWRTPPKTLPYQCVLVGKIRQTNDKEYFYAGRFDISTGHNNTRKLIL